MSCFIKCGGSTELGLSLRLRLNKQALPPLVKPRRDTHIVEGLSKSRMRPAICSAIHRGRAKTPIQKLFGERRFGFLSALQLPDNTAGSFHTVN